MNEQWRAINLANWESQVRVHAGPGGYPLAAFEDPKYLTDVVRYDLPRLGRLDDLDVQEKSETIRCRVAAAFVRDGR